MYSPFFVCLKYAALGSASTSGEICTIPRTPPSIQSSQKAVHADVRVETAHSGQGLDHNLRVCAREAMSITCSHEPLAPLSEP